jgi:hypothetical protein
MLNLAVLAWLVWQQRCASQLAAGI